ncbi:LOW QUALITY PROTEIN: vomeronasal type-2 receptor 26-like [Gastrophryne carolinensis]
MLLEDFYNFLSLVFAVDEINHNPIILPNVTLGYNVYDSYVDLFRTVQGAVRIYSGSTAQYPNYNCDPYGVLAAVIEGLSSSFSIQHANIFAMYKYPQIFMFDFRFFVSQDPIQSNKQKFPYFYRAVPSEESLYTGVIALIKHFGWKWIGIIYPDADSNINAIKIIKDKLANIGVCTDFILTVPAINDYNPARISQIKYIIEKSTANVILVYGSKNDVYYLELNVKLTQIPQKIWIHTADSSFRMINHVNDHMVNGSLRFILHKRENPSFIKFVQEVDPSRFPPGRTFTTWWDELCENRCPFNTRRRNCTGVESGRQILYSHCNLRFTGMSYTVYKSVYALANALNELYQEIPLTERLLDYKKLTFQDLKHWGPLLDFQWTHTLRFVYFTVIVLHTFIKRINFTNTIGDKIYFIGDEIPTWYDIYNAVYLPNYTIITQKVGNFNFQSPPEKQFIIDTESIVWESSFFQIPKAICSESCQPRSRKSSREGQPVCCYDCLPCPEGQFSNDTDAALCIDCPDDQWPNEEKTACFQKIITFLSYEEPIGIALTFITIFFSFIGTVVLGIFIKHQHTPIVKANNRDLSYLILISLIFSCLCCLLFLECPEQISYFLQQSIFGITFSISVSSLLAKTAIVVIAFNATKPGKNLRKWVGAKVPKYICPYSSSDSARQLRIWPANYHLKSSLYLFPAVCCHRVLSSLCFVASSLACWHTYAALRSWIHPKSPEVTSSADTTAIMAAITTCQNTFMANFDNLQEQLNYFTHDMDKLHDCWGQMDKRVGENAVAGNTSELTILKH